MHLYESAFDSSIFHIKWYRLELSDDWSRDALCTAITQSDAEYIDTKISTRHCHRERELKSLGFRKTCIQVNLHRHLQDEELDPDRQASPTDPLSGAIDPDELNGLVKGCATAFIRDRFSLDERLANHLVEEFHRRWIYNSLTNENMLRFIQPGSFITLKRPADQHAIIDLFATAPAHQRQGLGRRILSNAISWCRHQGVAEIGVTTETENPIALSVYRRQGFVVKEYVACLHLARDDFTG